MRILGNSRREAIGVFASLAIFAASGLMGSGGGDWSKLDEGLDLGKFTASLKAAVGDSRVVALRIDPSRYQLRLLTASECRHKNLTVRKWSEKYQLLAAVNAGMYQTDYRSNVGYMKNFDHVNNGRVHPKYLSAAAFNPHDPSKPSFRLFDLDVMPMAQVQSGYRSVVQNLRLIKRSAINVWPQQSRRWSEVALAEDKAGRILFIHCRSPYSMRDLNAILLELPLDIECAQHLEGGVEASLYVACGGEALELVGCGETGVDAPVSREESWPVPNVLGITKK